MRATPSIALAIALAAQGGPAGADRLIDARLVARGDYLAPQLSPDGTEILVTGPQLRGLEILSRAGGPSRKVTDDAEAGVHAKWTVNGITFRAQREGARIDMLATRDGAVRAHALPPPTAFTQDDRMFVQDRNRKLIRVGSGDRFFGAVVAPDGDKVVFQGLTTGLYLYVRSTGLLRYIGPGTAPAWSPDSTRIAYEVTEDDGHAIVASDIYVYKIDSDRAEPVTATDRLVERRPSFSSNGSEVVFDDNVGGVFIGRLEVR